MTAWLAPLIVFGLVVFIHELGHFLAAKWFGVYAPRFSIGFGPALLKWRKKETEYRVAAIPLGGYVRMASRLDEASAGLEGGNEDRAVGDKDYDPEAMRPFGPKPIPENRWFESKPYYARLIIMLAGVTMNLLLGWGINIGLAKGYTREFTTKISQVVPDKPAALSGMIAGDSVVSINSAPIVSWDGMVERISQSAGEQLRFEVIRDNEPLLIMITPSLDSVRDEVRGTTTMAGRIGAAPSLDSRPLSWPAAFSEGTRVTGEMGTLIFSSLKRLITRDIPMSELGGPVMIAEQSVKAAQAGWDALFYLVALISINLAVFNLLPIPILDGGQIVIQTVEAIRRKPLGDRAREGVAIFGLVLIALLFITVTFNDIKRWLFS